MWSSSRESEEGAGLGGVYKREREQIYLDL